MTPKDNAARLSVPLPLDGQRSTTRVADRAQELLDHCKSAFAAKGFDGASMQDLARAAGMSAGNFYRYYPSKDAIIQALVERDLAQIEQVFEMIIAASDPAEAFLGALEAQMAMYAETHEGVLWAEIEAAVNRKPDLRHILDRMEQTVLSRIIRIFSRLSGMAEQDCAGRFRGEGLYLLMLVRTAAMADCMNRPGAGAEARADSQAVRAQVLRTARSLLTEIIEAKS